MKYKPLTATVDAYQLTKDYATDSPKWVRDRIGTRLFENTTIRDGAVRFDGLTSIIFKDGNKRNFALDNLAAITKKERLDMNRHDLFSSDPQATETGILLARLRTTIHQKEKEIKHG